MANAGDPYSDEGEGGQATEATTVVFPPPAEPEADAAAPRGFELRWQGCNTGC